MEEREKGPVEILCKEIGFRFDRRMETVPIFTEFVRVLVDAIEHDLHVDESIAALPIGRDVNGEPIVPTDKKSRQVLEVMRSTLRAAHPIDMIERAAKTHDLAHELNPEESYPTNHTIDMLSSCASAIRFGLEKPCHSRHAAEAAGHIWRRLYGIRLEDSISPDWKKGWACIQLQEAILRLAINAP